MRLVACISALSLATAGLADLNVAKAVIVSPAGVSPTEAHAARELRDHLSQIAGKQIRLIVDAKSAPAGAIIVGRGALTTKLLPKANWSALKPEQTLIETVGNRLVVAGGRPRGTLYAVYRLLQVKCGVRWWTPWATTIPHNPKLKFAKMNWSETPAFEFRDPFWFHSFDADWAARNFDNGASTRVDDSRGGKTVYEGFVHTYYSLVPPSLFAHHPEWFSLINGKRTTDNAQLCTTNPELRDYIVEQVKERLRKNPQATIVSVSQNDCFNPCQCPVCRALAAKEGSDAALVLDLANYVGERIEKEFPNVAVDTLAYQWSRHPTKTMRPRKNVIVRLCSIECNFAYPLSAPQNASFGDDIRGWSKLTNRLYVWDYCTNFANYLQPEPDYFTLGPTIQWFAQNGVKGVFEEGDYTSNGGDMAELKAWLIAQMLWDPKQDPNKLIDEFLNGYYGPAAAPYMKQYLELMAEAAKSVHLGFAIGTNTPFLNFATIAKADALLAKAWSAPSGDANAIYPWRVSQARLSTYYTVLARWNEFRQQAGQNWPWPEKKDLIEVWRDWCNGNYAMGSTGPTGWTPVTAIDEGGRSPQAFVDAMK